MRVQHHIPAARLTKRYFRRWWTGKGYSKAMFEAMQPMTELGLDLREVPHIGGIPRYLIGDAVRDVVGYLAALLRRDVGERFRREMRLAYFLGFLRARALRRRPRYQSPGTPSQPDSAPAHPRTPAPSHTRASAPSHLSA
jgi:hypothetical protein